MARFFVASLLLLISVTGHADQPTVFPDFDLSQGSVSIVVATSLPGKELPEDEECVNGKAICLRSPLWFRASVLRDIYGSAPGKNVIVSTYSHYGQPDPDKADSPRLMLLVTKNGKSVMPVYASAQVWRHRDGEYYLLLYHPNPVHWLPCAAMELQESIDGNAFPRDIRLAANDYAVKQNPGSFATRGSHAVPRYGISVSRLADLLRVRAPKLEELRCEATK